MSTVSLPAEIVAWAGQAIGARLTSADRIPGGGRKEGWFVDFEPDDGGHKRELFLRLDRTDPSVTGDPWTIRREATVYTALADTAVPVARVLAVHPTLEVMISERMRGANWFSRISDPAEALAIAEQFMGHLAALHRLDPAELDLPGFPAPTSVPDLVRYELAEWAQILAHRGGTVDPALRFTLDWLERNIPDYDGPVVLVQGDTGPGNFMYEAGRVTAIVDWELAHLGDPMDDIAWLSLRAVQEPFTHFPDRLRQYEELSGHVIDDDRVRYYRVMAEAKLLVMGHRRERRREDTSQGGGGDIGNGMIYSMLHRRLWLEAMADATGLALDSVDTAPEIEAGEHAWLYDAVLSQLRDVIVPRITDPLAQQRTKGLARVIKYLARVDRDGAWYAQQELDELTQLLGHRPGSLSQARETEAALVRDGTIDDVTHLRYLWGRIARDDLLMRDASGALATRHWPPLR